MLWSFRSSVFPAPQCSSHGSTAPSSSRDSTVGRRRKCGWKNTRCQGAGGRRAQGDDRRQVNNLFEARRVLVPPYPVRISSPRRRVGSISYSERSRPTRYQRPCHGTGGSAMRLRGGQDLEQAVFFPAAGNLDDVAGSAASPHRRRTVAVREERAAPHYTGRQIHPAGPSLPPPQKTKPPKNLFFGGLLIYPRQRPTLPQSHPCSTIGAGELNYRVRDGNGCDLSAIVTGKLLTELLVIGD